MEYYEVLAKRRMYRHFTSDPIPPETLQRILDSAVRGPSAGYSQGFDFLVLDDPVELKRFWGLATTERWRINTVTHAGLWNAPVAILPMANPGAYVKRYSESDKRYANLSDEASWPVPYWFIDTAFASMLIMESVVNENLGSLFFGLFRNVVAVKKAFGIPDSFHPIGAIVIGHPSSDEPGKSANRPRREWSSQFHFNRF